jgi:hypothetical protein
VGIVQDEIHSTGITAGKYEARRECLLIGKVAQAPSEREVEMCEDRRGSIALVIKWSAHYARGTGCRVCRVTVVCTVTFTHARRALQMPPRPRGRSAGSMSHEGEVVAEEVHCVPVHVRPPLGQRWVCARMSALALALSVVGVCPVAQSEPTVPQSRPCLLRNGGHRACTRPDYTSVPASAVYSTSQPTCAAIYVSATIVWGSALLPVHAPAALSSSLAICCAIEGPRATADGTTPAR